MRRLILLRHAKTEAWNEGLQDRDRKLVTRGHQNAEAMASALVEMGWSADGALISSARRTRETWRHLAAHMPRCQATFCDDLYLAGTPAIEKLIGQAAGEHETLLVVGHNPGLHDMALMILRQAGSRDHQAAKRLWEKLPTGSAILFESEENEAFIPVHFKLAHFVRPKDLKS